MSEPTFSAVSHCFAATGIAGVGSVVIGVGEASVKAGGGKWPALGFQPLILNLAAPRFVPLGESQRLALSLPPWAESREYLAECIETGMGKVYKSVARVDEPTVLSSDEYTLISGGDSLRGMTKERHFLVSASGVRAVVGEAPTTRDPFLWVPQLAVISDAGDMIHWADLHSTLNPVPSLADTLLAFVSDMVRFGWNETGPDFVHYAVHSKPVPPVLSVESRRGRFG